MRELCILVSAASGFLFSSTLFAQSQIPLNDLSAFKNPGRTWAIGADAMADISKQNTLTLTPGTGVLANLPGSGGVDLYTTAEFGDIDLELEYMMAKGSNSGIYLQGMYELQLLDSWGTRNPTAGDNGGIYQRWDEAKPEGQKGYEGYAPRQNASKAPGLWQKLRISFQAPRFDATGKKIENAKFLRVELNGVTIHEDVELSGPTRGAMAPQERATGPIRIQGDHGPVAFRNIKITPFDKPRPEFSDIKYSVYRGRFYDTLDLKKLPPEAWGPLGNFTATSIQNLPGEYFIRYTGNIAIREPGDYSFNVAVPGGRGVLSINNKPLAQQGRGRMGARLDSGIFPFDLLFIKNQDWTNRALGIAISGPGIREYGIGDVVSGGFGADPIMVEATTNTVLRSFMDLPGVGRIVHAVSVGSPEKVHYTYDMDKGAIIQVWRGQFLDATPMWYSRGDGSSRPLGAVQRFKPSFAIARLNAPDAAWIPDSVMNGYQPKGYRLDKTDQPSFRYLLDGAQVEDQIRVLPDGIGLSREITLSGAAGSYYVRLAEGTRIDDAGNGLYLVDDKSYYIRVDDAGGARPAVRTANGRSEVVVPLQQKLRYSILF